MVNVSTFIALCLLPSQEPYTAYRWNERRVRFNRFRISAESLVNLIGDRPFLQVWRFYNRKQSLGPVLAFRGKDAGGLFLVKLDRHKIEAARLDTEEHMLNPELYEKATS